MKKNKKRQENKRREKLTALITLFTFAIVIAVVLNFSSAVRPYQIIKNEVSTATVRAPQTVVDDKKTASERAIAGDNVPDVYTINSNITQNQNDSVTALFTSIRQVQSDEKKAKAAAIKDKKQFTAFDEKEITTRVRALLSKNDLTFEHTNISDDSFVKLYKVAPDKLTDLETTIGSVIAKQLQKGVTEGQLLNIRADLQLNISELAIASNLRSAASDILNAAITVNSFYDSDATSQQRSVAENNVQPVRILQGQVIIQEGQLVTDDIYRQLELLHLVKSQMNILQIIGNTLIAMVIALTTYFLIYRARKKRKDFTIAFVIFTAIISLSYAMLLVFRYISERGIDNLFFVLPVVFVPMVLQLLGYRELRLLGIMQIVLASVLVLQNAQNMANIIYFTVYILITGLVATLILNKPKTRNDLFIDSMYITAFNGVSVFIIQLINNTAISSLSFWWPIFYGMIGGLIAFILSLGLQPLFETIFGVLSPNRLLELASPSQPLLKQMMNEAPGTYHHSLMVANLAEAATEAIGADSLYTRVACYYHDVGKMINPAFFVENQYSDKSPHDLLTATESRDIIIEHASGGAEILKRHHFPQPIIDMAQQHHGTTILKFFYHAEKQNNPEVDKADFRYPGPKPQTREIAVVNIADSVEAAVRSMKAPSIDKMKDLIEAITTDRLLDGQFDECELSMKDIVTVKETLLKVLVGVYHQRIEYPK
ncbi:Membrane protein containing HD superfamily hydrolase domain, YQFF ortholog [Brachybacterium faecium]|nr:Membrane protein containing HD superfamily hydrolase domain, YQFF ortholog [Brachybacterium faecium]